MRFLDWLAREGDLSYSGGIVIGLVIGVVVTVAGYFIKSKVK